MTSPLQFVRTTASYSALWNLVPVALATVALVTAVLVQQFGGATEPTPVIVDSMEPAPLPDGPHGA